MIAPRTLAITRSVAGPALNHPQQAVVIGAAPGGTDDPLITS